MTYISVSRVHGELLGQDEGVGVLERGFGQAWDWGVGGTAVANWCVCRRLSRSQEVVGWCFSRRLNRGQEVVGLCFSRRLSRGQEVVFCDHL